MRGRAIAVVTVMLSGCAGVNYVAENYGTMQPTIVETANNSYRVYDKPERGKVLVQRNPTGAVAQSFVGGRLLDRTIAADPKPYYQRAAEQHLRQTGRSCQIRDGYLVVEPSWEFAYDCESVVTGAISPTEESAWHNSVSDYR
jgi:hypothetical protein